MQCKSFACTIFPYLTATTTTIILLSAQCTMQPLFE